MCGSTVIVLFNGEQKCHGPHASLGTRARSSIAFGKGARDVALDVEECGGKDVWGERGMKSMTDEGEERGGRGAIKLARSRGTHGHCG